MRITVAICTWNRCELLQKTLEAMLALEIPPGTTWNLIVVDNNSSDNTVQVVERFRDRLPIRYYLEQEQGLSNARNAAINQSDCDFILWTDDDVIVDSKWLVHYCGAFERWPEAAVFGGKVLPWFEVTPPSWLRENMHALASSYALRDLGDEERALVEPECPFGANMAFRMDAFDGLRFDPELGRVKKSLVGGEEVQIISALRHKGKLVIWVPNCSVEHYLPKSRMTLSYVRSYFVGQGFVSDEGANSRAKKILGMDLWRLRLFLTLTFRAAMQRASGQASDTWIKTTIYASKTLGVLKRQRATRV
ncbi:MAG: glycosyltransferase [Pseudomonadota bacterium]